MDEGPEDLESSNEEIISLISSRVRGRKIMSEEFSVEDRHLDS